MDMLKERQLTVRASRRPVEYNYTNADIHHTDTNPSDGYQFEYPVNWTADQSTQKVIGIRRISYKPSSLDIAFRITVEPETQNEIEIPVVNVFTDQNTFEECINKIVLDINEVLTTKNTPYKCVSSYNKELSTFDFKFDTGSTYKNFTIDFPYGLDYTYQPDQPGDFNKAAYIHYKVEYLKLFNQPITKENVDKVHNYGETTMQMLEYNNVWNRDSFYCHASFSDSPKQIIGINNDFWPTPSVLYEHSDNSNDFNVYFTTDTVHRILPRNGVMLIQLSYIFNYQTSMLSYT